MNAKWIFFYIELFLLILIGNQHPFTVAIENSTIIKDGQLLVSNNKNFALGFFTLGNSNSTTRRYVGIRYNDIPDQTLVWVANRNKPLHDNSGTFAIDTHGNLVIYTITQNISLWSTNVSIPSRNDVSFHLLDTGNLVVIHTQSQEILWQSFDYPSHTLLPYMKIGFNRRTGFGWFLTSWKGPDDPGDGNFTLRVDSTGILQMFLYQNNVPRWRAGSWNGRGWSGVPEMTTQLIFNVTYFDNAEEVSFANGYIKDRVLMRLGLDEAGFLRRTWRREQDQNWIDLWFGPTEWCDSYNRCGPNSNCNQYNVGQPQCGCLPGFEPGSPRDWLLRDTKAGCVRKRENATCRSGEGFVRVARVKAPDTSKARVDRSLNLEECRQACLEDCNCTAYTSTRETTGIGCIRWYGDLVDTRTYATFGQDLYVRVDAVELAQYPENSNQHLASKRNVAAIVAVSIIATLLLVTSLLVYLLHERRKRRERQSLYNYFGDSPNPSELLGDQRSRTSDHLPVVFDLNTIKKATSHFSFQNKLGEGGFGSVYKGRLKSGEEIAVKRLAKSSGQGIGEFKNEVTLIAKLQHRNLVRILGYCLQHEEKMLVYEYLPNKSLDSFIFDESKRALLDWAKRFEIIIGIARGILYLHQDSRLKIIHRDLKASNVLLDGDLNPKIADFGLAKVFSNDQIQANTNHIVGTYGYMSPEYAMEGLFSEKSDVYSYGVLLLEIIAGRKNNSYKDASYCINLVGQVWELWKVDKAMEAVDSTLDESNSSFGNAIMKCIQIGLLCVEDDPTDRPTMSTVVFMLSNEVVLHAPKNPAFIFKRSNYKRGDPLTSTTEGTSSINDVTISMLEVR